MTPFRNWIHNLWIDNCEEHNVFGEKKYTKAEYFQKYKWWLRREYKFQKQRNTK